MNRAALFLSLFMIFSLPAFFAGTAWARGGYSVDDCLECHGDADIKGKTASSGRSVFIDPARFAATTHGQGEIACIDCHVGANLGSHPKDGYPRPDCTSCHKEKGAISGFGDALARWSIAGHAKGDFSRRYSKSECLACHQGAGAHGEDGLTGDDCRVCHRPAEKIKAGEKGFHVDAAGGGLFYSFAGNLYSLLLILGALAAVSAPIFRAVRAKKEKKS